MTTIEQIDAIVRDRFATTNARVTATASHVEVADARGRWRLLLWIQRGDARATCMIELSTRDAAGGLGAVMGALVDLIRPLSALAASDVAGDESADPDPTGPARTGAVAPLPLAAD